MDQLQALIEAINSGAPQEEINLLMTQVPWDEIPEDDLTVQLREIEDWGAYTQASLDTGVNLQTGTAPIIGGGGGPQILSRTTAEGVKEITSEGSKFIASKSKDPALVSRVLQWMRAHPFKTTAIGGSIGMAAQSFFQGVQESGATDTGIDPTLLSQADSYLSQQQARAQQAVAEGSPISIAQASAPSVDYGYNVLVHDRDGRLTGTPGSIAVISPQELGGGVVSPQQFQGLAETPAASPLGVATQGADLVNAALFGPGANVPGLNIDNRVIQTISPHSNVSVKINAPVQLPKAPPVPTGRPIGTEADYRPGGIFSPVRPTDGQFEQGTDTARRVEGGRASIPAGAEIQPRSFQTERGRTLLEWANIIAKRNGVPLNILYGIIDHESGWLKTAVGDNGTSFGLAQIHLTPDAYGGSVSRAQALDPIFAMEWTAKQLSQRFKQYGRWDAAIAAHNSPVAAQYLARTGRFQNEKSARYVASVMSRSNTSGLDNVIFGEDELEGIPIDGTGGGGGATYTPFQGPDPAASREFIEATYQDLLGRKPTEDEFAIGLARIESLAKQSYQANLTQAKGGTSQAVDVEAQFRAGIKETGEFAFTEDTHQLNSFTDYAAGVGRLLQQGL